MPLDYTHEHLSSQIMQDGYPNTPIAGAQRVRLLGPFRIAFDADDIGSSNGALLTDAVPAGAALIVVWAEVTTTWDFSEEAFIHIYAAPNSDPSDAYGLVFYNITTETSFDWVPQGDAFVGVEGSTTDGSIPPRRLLMTRLIADGRLTFKVVPAAASGEADIYALIAEPA
jgi:hypothetical protein